MKTVRRHALVFSTVILVLFYCHGVEFVDVIHMDNCYLRFCVFYAWYFHIVDSVVT